MSNRITELRYKEKAVDLVYDNHTFWLAPNSPGLEVLHSIVCVCVFPSFSVKTFPIWIINYTLISKTNKQTTTKKA